MQLCLHAITSMHNIQMYMYVLLMYSLLAKIENFNVIFRVCHTHIIVDVKMQPKTMLIGLQLTFNEHVACVLKTVSSFLTLANANMLIKNFIIL